MTFEVEVGGRARIVEARGPEIFLDGRRFHVDAARVGRVWSLLVEPADAGGHNADRGVVFNQATRSYEVAVEHAAGGLTVHVNGHRIAVRSSLVRGGARPPDPRTGHELAARGKRSAGGAEAPSHGRLRVVAPMPGRIAKVLVKVGDAVEARQGVVVVEAMKMENELRSPCVGTVTHVSAIEGALVDANAVLVVIDS